MERWCSSSSVALLLVLALALGARSFCNHHQAPTPATQRGNGDTVVIIMLRGKDQAKPASVAVRTRDISLAGFSYGSDHWHAFPGYEGTIPGATTLPFGNSYRDLIGGLSNLPSLPLEKAALKQAARALAAHDPSTADAHALGKALATVKVMMSEGLRLRPVKEALVAAEREGRDARVAPEHLPLIEHWDAICYEVLHARRTGKWGGGPFARLLRERAGIHGLEEALAVVGGLMNRTEEEVRLALARGA